MSDSDHTWLEDMASKGFIQHLVVSLLEDSTSLEAIINRADASSLRALFIFQSKIVSSFFGCFVPLCVFCWYFFFYWFVCFCFLLLPCLFVLSYCWPVYFIIILLGVYFNVHKPSHSSGPPGSHSSHGARSKPSLLARPHVGALPVLCRRRQAHHLQRQQVGPMNLVAGLPVVFSWSIVCFTDVGSILQGGLLNLVR